MKRPLFSGILTGALLVFICLDWFVFYGEHESFLMQLCTSSALWAGTSVYMIAIAFICAILLRNERTKRAAQGVVGFLLIISGATTILFASIGHSGPLVMSVYDGWSYNSAVDIRHFFYALRAELVNVLLDPRIPLFWLCLFSVAAIQPHKKGAYARFCIGSLISSTFFISASFLLGQTELFRMIPPLPHLSGIITTLLFGIAAALCGIFLIISTRREKKAMRLGNI